MARLTTCSHPGCPILTQGGRCPQHGSSAQPSASSRGYGSLWNRTSQHYRAAHPICEECRAQPSKVVDHLDGKGPAHDNRWSNLEALCIPCHNSRTLRYEGGRGNPKRARPVGMKKCRAHPECVGVR